MVGTETVAFFRRKYHELQTFIAHDLCTTFLARSVGLHAPTNNISYGFQHIFDPLPFSVPHRSLLDT